MDEQLGITHAVAGEDIEAGQFVTGIEAEGVADEFDETIQESPAKAVRVIVDPVRPWSDDRRNTAQANPLPTVSGAPNFENSGVPTFSMNGAKPGRKAKMKAVEV